MQGYPDWSEEEVEVAMAYFPGHPGLVEGADLDRERLFYTDPEVELGPRLNLTQPTDQGEELVEVDHDVLMVVLDELEMRAECGSQVETPLSAGRYM